MKTNMSDPSLNSSSAHRIPVIGIVGGVGSGKSSVARKLAEFCPVAIVDADRLGHRALALPDVKDKLRQRFGPTIFDEQGVVIRANLAAQVFGETPAASAARADLEKITHPEIGRLALAQIEQHRATNAVRWIILDAALLLEAGWRELCDLVAFIDVSADRRAEQVRTQRGWSLEEWRRREASQWPVEMKRAAADIVVSNNGMLKDSACALQAALERRFPSNMCEA